MKKWYLRELSISFLGISLFVIITNVAEGASMKKAYHGTLNVVVATPDELIAATDSRATITGGEGKLIRREDNHQKLFVVPGNILVTIAGYNRVAVPTSPEFTAPAAGIILDYIDTLQSNHRNPSYDEALSTLIHLLTFNLTSVANINAWTNGTINPNWYLFQMIVAGRKDDAFVMTKVILTLTLQGSAEKRHYVTSEASELIKKKVTSFSYLTAGWDVVADEVLKKIKGEPTRNEMEQAIRDAMQKTNAANQGVGGAIQQAYLSKKGLDVSIPSYPRPPGPSVKYNLLVGGGMANVKIAVVSNTPFLFIASSFENTGVILDGNYFYGTLLKTCNIYINSNAFNFDKTNKIENCKLYVGKKVDKTLPKYKQLSSRFNPQNIYYER